MSCSCNICSCWVSFNICSSSWLLSFLVRGAESVESCRLWKQFIKYSTSTILKTADYLSSVLSFNSWGMFSIFNLSISSRNCKHIKFVSFLKVKRNEYEMNMAFCSKQPTLFVFFFSYLTT